MKYKSIWEEERYKDLDKLDCDKSYDVLIIGGGLTGISCAYNLINSGLNVGVVEQYKIGSSTTSKTTAKINYLQEMVYSYLTNKYSYSVAKKYLRSQLDGISFIINSINKNNIDCNLEKVSSYVFTNKQEEVDKLKRERFILKKMGIKVNEYSNLDINIKSKYAIEVNDTYIFNPLKYLYSLTDICLDNNIDIYEKTKVIKIKKEKNMYLCFTENNIISAKKVVLASHYPFFLFPMFMPAKAYIERSYVSASLTDKYKNSTYITASNPCKSIRYYKDYIIYLCNSHNICNNLNEKKNYYKLIKDIKKLNLEPSYVWSNDDLITIDKMPYIGSIRDNLYICTGYNTWGMTNASVAAIIIKDLILGKENEYISLFNPKRTKIVKNILGYTINISSSAKSFIQNKLIKNKKWYISDVTFKKIDGVDFAIYNDINGKHIVKNKCPHMGCSLIFNEIEKTWDCPCHASRFDLNGNCIKGPSKYSIKYN